MTSFYDIVWIHADGLKLTLVSKGAKPKFADDQSSLALDPDLLKKAVVACAASATRRAQTAMSVDTCELAACCNVDMKRKLEIFLNRFLRASLTPT